MHSSDESLGFCLPGCIAPSHTQPVFENSLIMEATSVVGTMNLILADEVFPFVYYWFLLSALNISLLSGSINPRKEGFTHRAQPAHLGLGDQCRVQSGRGSRSQGPQGFRGALLSSGALLSTPSSRPQCRPARWDLETSCHFHQKPKRGSCLKHTLYWWHISTAFFMIQLHCYLLFLPRMHAFKIKRAKSWL